MTAPLQMAQEVGRVRRFLPTLGDSRVRYIDIVDQLASAVENGQLLPGDRLPPQRTLADRLKVAVGTITRAYAEAERRGLVMAEVGRGTFIAGIGVPHPQAERALADVLDLTHNRLPIDGYVGEFCKTLGYISKRPNVAAMLDYPPNGNDARFRTVGSQWIQEVGMVASPDRVILCNEVQHGLSVIFEHYRSRVISSSAKTSTIRASSFSRKRIT